MDIEAHRNIVLSIARLHTEDYIDYDSFNKVVDIANKLSVDDACKYSEQIVDTESSLLVLGELLAIGCQRFPRATTVISRNGKEMEAKTSKYCVIFNPMAGAVALGDICVTVESSSHNEACNKAIDELIKMINSFNQEFVLASARTMHGKTARFAIFKVSSVTHFQVYQCDLLEDD